MVKRCCPALALLLITALGCKDGPVKYTLTGVVEIDGQAVEEGDMTFLPDDKEMSPEGARIQSGKYSVLIAPGAYTVKINAPKKVPLLPGETSAYGDKEKLINAVPEHYNEQGKLTANVKESTTIDFKLSSKN
jgi:hypothetical protein